MNSNFNSFVQTQLSAARYTYVSPEDNQIAAPKREST